MISRSVYEMKNSLSDFCKHVYDTKHNILKEIYRYNLLKCDFVDVFWFKIKLNCCFTNDLLVDFNLLTSKKEEGSNTD